MAAGLAAIWPVMNAYVMDLFPDANMGGDLGATRTVFMGIGSVGPLTVGVVADVMTFSTAFLGLVLCLLASTVILVLCTLDSQ
jgi:MFS family permease